VALGTLLIFWSIGCSISYF